MLYFLAIFCPPLAVLIKGKPFSAILNFILCFFLWFPGVIHAFMVISSSDAQDRADEHLRQMKRQHAQTMETLKMQQEIEQAKLNQPN
jgi:uncharacterized membrane protein YqaE (UPF0057 family)